MTQLEFAQSIESLGQQLRRYFRYHCPEYFEDLAQETLLRVTASLESKKETPADFEAFAVGIARNVYSEYVRKAVRERRLVKGLEVFPPPYWDTQSELKHHCLDRCIDALPAKDRELLERYYFMVNGKQKPVTRESLAMSHSMSLNALRLTIHRIKDRLAGCVSSCCKDSDNERSV